MSGLRAYLVAAAAARTADEGMAPALALLVTAAGREASLAGVLLAAAGLPHVVAGPVAGAVLDGEQHRRAVLALAPRASRCWPARAAPVRCSRAG